MIVNDQLIIPLCKALSPHQPRGGGRQAERRGLRLEPAPPPPAALLSFRATSRTPRRPTALCQ